MIRSPFTLLGPLVAAGLLLASTTAARAQAPKWQWTQACGGSGTEYSRAMTIDRDGNIYAAGIFSESIGFGSDTLRTTWNTNAIFIAKCSPAGVWQWARRIVGVSGSDVGGIAVDAGGNVYVGGSVKGSATLGSGGEESTLAAIGDFDAVVAKYSPSGTLLWGKRWGGSGEDRIGGVTALPSGDIAVAGLFNGTMPFGAGSVTSAGGADIFIARCSADGAESWIQRAGGAAKDAANDVRSDAAGNLYMAGQITGTVAFGDKQINGPSRNSNLFLARYSPSGDVVWAIQEGGADFVASKLELAVDAAGNCFVAGDFITTVEFGGVPVENTGEMDGFVLGFNNSGEIQWGKLITGIMIEEVSDIATDAAGNVYVGGYSQDMPDGEIFVIKYAGDGSLRWMKANGNSDVIHSSFGGAIGADAAGNVFMSGSYSGRLNVGSTLLPWSVGSSPNASNGFDLFLARLGSAAGVDAASSIASAGFVDGGVAPNPTSGRASVNFSLATPGEVSLSLVDARGATAATLADGFMEAGPHAVDLDTRSLPPGAYMVTLRAHGTIATRRLVVVH